MDGYETSDQYGLFKSCLRRSYFNDLYAYTYTTYRRVYIQEARIVLVLIFYFYYQRENTGMLIQEKRFTTQVRTAAICSVCFNHCRVLLLW